MKNLKTLIIVESPNKIDSIKKYLDDTYEVYASSGQIMDLAKGGRFGIGVNPLANFKTYYCLIPSKIGFLDKIISNVDSIEKILIASDPDTEGEGIAWHVAQSLKHLNKPMFRAEFHEITKEGIAHGLANTTELDINKFKAQETRRVLDRIVGFMVSPFLMNYYSTNLSAGRVQSVATRMVIERESDINEFEPQEYWNIGVNLTKDNKSIFAKCQSKVKSKEDAEKMKVELESPSIAESVFEAVSVSRKPKKEQPEPPLTTARMQQLMSSKHGVDGEITMQAAQSLFELGLVTYIRTDSVRISDGALDNVRQWLQESKIEIPTKPNIFKNKGAAQDAHECIRPTNLTNLPENIHLSTDVKTLYKLIWTHFVSSQMCPAVYDTLDVKISHVASGHKFKVSGKVLVSAGYLALLEGKVKSDDELPAINESDKFKLIDNKSVILEQKFTQPPARYNYATLLKELENKGIGRPSSYVEIISKITSRNYVEKQGNTYYGTKLGSEITGLLQKYFDFMQYDYTSELEKQMDEVSLGNMNSLDVLSNFYSTFRSKLRDAHLATGGKVCEKCAAPMYQKPGRNETKFWGCSLYPFCSSTADVELKICA
jgi:DNA topoisomerase I